MPRTLGGGRRRMTVLLVLAGLGQALCVVALSVALHVLAARARHPPGPSGAAAGPGGAGGAGGPSGGAVWDSPAHWPAAALVALLAAAAVAAVALQAVRPPLAERLAQSYVHAVRMLLFDHLAHSVAWGPGRRTVGVTVLRFTGDAAALRLWVGRGLASLLVDGVSVAGTLAALAVLSPGAGAAAAVLVAATAAGSVLVGRGLAGRLRETRRHSGRLAAFVNERVTHTAVLQSLGRVRQERRMLSRRSRRLGEAAVEQARWAGALGALAEGCRIGTALVVVGVGFSDASHRELLGWLLPVAGFLGGPVSSLTRVQEYRQASAVARRRICEVLSVPAPLRPPAGAGALRGGPGRLDLADVCVEGVLDGVTACAEPGSRVAVTGPAGGGKSLLLAVAARLAVPDRGSVALDGRPLARHDPDSVHRAVRLVSRDLPPLRGSVSAGLRHGDPPRRPAAPRTRRPGPPPADTARDRARRHARDHARDGAREDPPDPARDDLAGRLEERLAAALPRGLDTRVGEGGLGLSAALRHRVALVRAVRSRPPVLLVDEADLAGELFEEVWRDYPGSVVCVTAAAHLLAGADAVWVLEGGRLAVLPARAAAHPAGAARPPLHGARRAPGAAGAGRGAPPAPGAHPRTAPERSVTNQ
ncbi:ATP-binding cassette domain-containing protein [Streptomyces sp. NPDC001380]|uniref:ATP-binding cassette domain-containing protein n=1 Tax=Streptomyces sp. NPDC001380 TaxID=3364566 RepID=UPI00368E061A